MSSRSSRSVDLSQDKPAATIASGIHVLRPEPTCCSLMNIVVFLWMTLHGVLCHQGSNLRNNCYTSAQTALCLVLSQGEWWRLLSAIFVHIGLIHIATNMWCLWNLGLLGEPLLGPWGMVSVYCADGDSGKSRSRLAGMSALPTGSMPADQLASTRWSVREPQEPSLA